MPGFQRSQDTTVTPHGHLRHTVDDDNEPSDFADVAVR
jgi:hypothetical protein